MRSFPEVNYRQCCMNLPFDNSAADKEVLSEGILQSRFLGNNLFKGAPSTSVHCGRALHRNHLLNVEITNVLIVFENRIVSSQPKAIEGCDTLLKRNIDTILLSITKIAYVISALQQFISVKCTTAMHTGWRCPFKKWICAASNFIALISSRSSCWQFLSGVECFKTVSKFWKRNRKSFCVYVLHKTWN